ncbi:hypothetical protein BBW65_01680 [Helicobacter enhydrae]|uniref:Lipoprotein n=1 Tax=Helicobacter enhydrae TaxID=222136 RepID=A0A1B1U486_9HELI|nr:hypothetical protein [Helicobacter enhydrae]ANV97594.1 hypothetical protein BBW65_01680 [Helicobacter enhydrae]
MEIRKILPMILFGCFALLWTGCSSVSLKEVTSQYYNGDVNKALKLAESGSAIHKKQNTQAGADDLLWQIQAGVIAFELQKPEALKFLEKAEGNIKVIEEKGLMSGLFENFGALLVNDTVIPYRGYLYEGVMVNYYKALYYMAHKDGANARIELNRASDRQRRAKEYYEKDIAQAKKAQTKMLESKENKAKQSSADQGKEADKILASYSNLSEFQNFNGYINPFVDYVSGVFFYIQGDQGKSQDFLKEAMGVTQNLAIQKDFELVSQKRIDKKYTWILIEDGIAPSKSEKGFSITLPVFTGDGVSIMNASLALPDPKRGVDFATSYTLLDNQGKSTEASMIATLNPLFFNEFKKQLPFIVTRNILSMAVKLGVQAGVAQIGGTAGLIGNLAGALYSRASTSADLRIVSTFPNAFYALRVENNQGEYELFAGKRKIARITLSDNCDKISSEAFCTNQNNMVYVRNANHNVFLINLISK